MSVLNDGLSPTNPLNYNPITIGLPIANSLFGSKGGPGVAPDDGDLSLQNAIARIKAGIHSQGRSQDVADAVVNSFRQQFGRDPTQSEFSQLIPSFQASSGTGLGAVSNLYDQTQNTPTAIAAKQQADALAAYTANSDKYNQQINGVFQNSVGRNATNDELQHFGSLLASGQVDQYGVQQLLGQTQEAQQAQTQKYQDQLNQNLQQTQGDYFKNYINPSILSQTAAAGRDPNSSGVQQAEVQAGKQQNYDLQNYLAQFGAGQYGQSAQNQQGVYQQYLGNLYGLQNANVNQKLQQQSYNQQNNTNLQNYYLQQQAYNNYISQYGQRSNGLGQLIGGLVGGGLGAFGGPAGAAAGFGIGSSLGGLAQGGGNQQYGQIPNYSGLGNSWGSFGSSGGNRGFSGASGPAVV